MLWLNQGGGQSHGARQVSRVWAGGVKRGDDVSGMRVSDLPSPAQTGGLLSCFGIGAYGIFIIFAGLGIFIAGRCM
jgi:hypothetical protein